MDVATYTAYMPSRNRVKVYAEDAYYHVYSRGVEKRRIFVDREDCTVFMSLLKRYLSGERSQDRFHRPYEDLSDEIELLAFCLVPNHLHLLVYQKSQDGLTRLMRRVLGSYSMYFNKKYDRVGTLFQDRYKAALIDNEAHLWHISRYIHLNAIDAGGKIETYPYSSYPYYTAEPAPAWLKPQRILNIHNENQHNYAAFVHDYSDHKQALDEIKHGLANSVY